MLNFRLYSLCTAVVSILLSCGHAMFAQSTGITLQSMIPNSAPVGSAAVTVTLTGSGFTNSSFVVVGGRRLEPMSVSSTRIVEIFPADLFNSSQPLGVYVSDSADSSSSQLLSFYVYSLVPPKVTSMIPAGGVRGTTLLIGLTGTDLTGATFAFSGTGVSARPDSSAVEVTVATDAPLGSQAVTISTPSGSTTLCGTKQCTFTIIESGSWSDLSPPAAADGGTRVRLLDGRVLVAGGSTFTPGVGQRAVSTTQIFDPATGQWTSTGSLNIARAGASGSLLPDGRVLLAGGGDFSSGIASAEIYNPSTGTWSLTGSTTDTAFGKALLLPSGKVLVQTGSGNFEAFAGELFDPATGDLTRYQA